MKSYLEATARQRIAQLVDAHTWQEILPPSARMVSPHLAQLDSPVAFDDGVVIGRAAMAGHTILLAAQEGGFMGGAIGEVHGAKLVGLLRLAVQERPAAVLLLLESGGVRLHEANAGLIAVAEVMRALLEVRAKGIAVVVLNGGANGCFGGTGILARCANWLVMSEQARLAMSGPEVIESVQGVEEFDARDKALVWRTTGGKHRYVLGDCDALVEDDCAAFRNAGIAAIARFQSRATPTAVALTLSQLEQEQSQLAQRIGDFGKLHDPVDIWRTSGIANAEQVPLWDCATFLNMIAREAK
jgi:malonate decarboxylase beta subunit